MTDEATAPETDSAHEDGRGMSRLEVRLSQAEAQIHALQDRMAEIDHLQRVAKNRALWFRVILLAAFMTAFFVLQSLKGG